MCLLRTLLHPFALMYEGGKQILDGWFERQALNDALCDDADRLGDMGGLPVHEGRQTQ